MVVFKGAKRGKTSAYVNNPCTAEVRENIRRVIYDCISHASGISKCADDRCKNNLQEERHFA